MQRTHVGRIWEHIDWSGELEAQPEGWPRREEVLRSEICFEGRTDRIC